MIGIKSMALKEWEDPYPDIKYLISAIEEGKIASSVRYSDRDIEKYGLEQVSQWINEDLDRFDSCGISWHMMQIRAEATILVYGVEQRITSGGLFGVESDSGESYINDVKQEELHNLETILLELGFSREEIALARKESNL